MIVSKLRSGKEVSEILKPLYAVASSQIRDHFLDPGVILVLAGAHPATRITIHNPSQEIFHEIRTINLLLKKYGIRIRLSTKHLRKEVNNLQRLASLIIESIDGYYRLSKFVFPKERTLNSKKGFIEVEKWIEDRIANDKKAHQSLLVAIEEGEVSYTKLNLIDNTEKDQLINSFLNLQETQFDKKFHDEKYFNLLSRLKANAVADDHTFEEIIDNLKIILKNSHLLSLGLNRVGLVESTFETLNEMFTSKYSLVRKLAENILYENSHILRGRENYANNFSTHSVEKKIYQEAIKRLAQIEKSY